MEARARLGNSSLIWKSIIATKDLMKKEARWRVGNRANIKVWSDKWLPTPNSHQGQSPITIMHGDALVKNY